MLLIYRDDPCVVIGRNQNPWKEVNFLALRARPSVPFIRRRSGGGTVYHVSHDDSFPCSLTGRAHFKDLGNTNFSIHLPRRSFDRHATAQVVLRAVRSLCINARVNERNDICVGQEKINSFYRVPRVERKRLICSARLRIGIQDCEQKSISSWNDAHFFSSGYIGRPFAY